MKTLTPTECTFVVSILDRSRYFNASPSGFGTRSPIIETRLGYHDVARYAAIMELGEPKKSGTRWRVRTKGPKAEALNRELLPELNDRAEEHAEYALSQITANAVEWYDPNYKANKSAANPEAAV